MSANPSTKWFWNDWDNDLGLALCSLAAQGLWMRMLSIAARSGGYVKVADVICSPDDIAEIVGKPASDVRELIGELEARKVFSRTRNGTIYSRRMLRDRKRLAKKSADGKKGGNPKLLADRVSGVKQTKKSAVVNHQDKLPDKPVVAPLTSLSPLVPIPKEEDSEAKASGAEKPAPADDAVKDLWDRGVAIVGKKNRPLMGKLVQEYGKVSVLASIAEVERENPADPISYLLACCKQGKANGRSQQRAYDILAQAAVEFDERQSCCGPAEAAYRPPRRA